MTLTSGERITGRRFEGLTMAELHLRATELHDCHFSRCDLREAELLGCRLNECTFEACDMSLAAFPESEFRAVTMRECKLLGVNWPLAKWPPLLRRSPVAFERSTLDYGSFLGLTLHKLRLFACSLREVDFSEADLSGADFREARLEGSLFRQTVLAGANFEGARDYTINPTANDIHGARFSMPEALALLHQLDIILDD